MDPVLTGMAAQHLTAFHQAALAGGEIIPPVQHPSVVPDDEIVRLPGLPPDVLIKRGV